jgi:hypothetical protein
MSDVETAIDEGFERDFDVRPMNRDEQAAYVRKVLAIGTREQQAAMRNLVAAMEKADIPTCVN